MQKAMRATQMTDRTPYQEGFRAHAQGKAFRENPYTPGSYSYQDWQRGWAARDEHMNDRAEVLAELGF